MVTLAKAEVLKSFWTLSCLHHSNASPIFTWVLLCLWSERFFEACQSFLVWVDSNICSKSVASIAVNLATWVFETLLVNVLWGGITQAKRQTQVLSQNRNLNEEYTGCSIVVREVNISTWHVSFISDDISWSFYNLPQ